MRRPLCMFAVCLAVAACTPQSSPPPAVIRPATTAPAKPDRSTASPPAIDPASTRPTPRRPGPSPAALRAFAGANAALLAGDTPAAIRLFDEVMRLDAASAEPPLLAALAIESFDAATPADRARATELAARAVALDPASLTARVVAARMLLNHTRPDEALAVLRPATLLPAYRDGGGDAMAVDFLLVRALDSAGYTAAALRQAEALVADADAGTQAPAAGPLAMRLLHRPEIPHVLLAALLERNGRPKDAAAAYRRAASLTPGGDSALRIRAAVLQARAGDARAATADLLALVDQTDGAAYAVAAARQVYQLANEPTPYAGFLRPLADSSPGAAIALAALHRDEGRADDAADVLAAAARRWPRRASLLREMARVLVAADRPRDAARRLIALTTADPQLASVMGDAWEIALRPSAGGTLRIDDLADLAIPAADEPARWRWQATLATQRGDVALAAAAVTRAGAPLPGSPVVSPTPLTDRERLALARLAAGQLLAPDDIAGMNPAVQWAAVDAARAGSEEQVLLLARVAADRPWLASAQSRLLAAADAAGDPEWAAGILSRWSEADRASPALRLVRARRLTGPATSRPASTNWAASNPTSSASAPSDRAAQAVAILRGSVAADPSDAATLQALADALRLAGRPDEADADLRSAAAATPLNLPAVQAYVRDLARRRRAAEATAFLDSMGPSARGLVEPLTCFAELYAELGERSRAMNAARAALAVNPAAPEAAGILAASLADAAESTPGALGEAARLIDAAVARRPTRAGLLLTAARVHYLRGRFDDAAAYASRAVAARRPADAAALDLLGDSLYRAARPDDARAAWESATVVLLASPGDPGSLRLKVAAKLRQLAAGREVTTSPTAP